MSHWLAQWYKALVIGNTPGLNTLKQNSWKNKRHIELSNVSRLGNFWKFLVKNILTKVAKIYGAYWAILKHYFWSKNECDYFWQTGGNIWATCYFNIWSRWINCERKGEKYVFTLNGGGSILCHVVSSSLLSFYFPFHVTPTKSGTSDSRQIHHFLPFWLPGQVQQKSNQHVLIYL